MMLLAVPAVALLGAGVTLRAAVEPPHTHASAPAANNVRGVAVVDSTPQSARSYSAPTPRPQLPDPEPDAERPMVTIGLPNVLPVNDEWNGPVRPIDVDLVDLRSDITIDVE